MSGVSTDASAARRPWGRAALWLAFLGPFFFLSYGFANNWAASRAHVPSVVFDWELAYIPFLPAFMLPYMSIDAFYAASLFVAKTPSELSRLAQRLLLATVVSVGCFLAFPLRVTFEKPVVDGFNGLLLEALTSFDKPFNAAPSLHISLLIILWAVYAKHLFGWRRWALDAWFALIAMSVLLTWQHHFFDVPTGALVGFGVLYLLPDERGVWRWHGSSPRGRRIAAGYLGAAALCAWGGTSGGAALWLFWPAVSFGLVAMAYLGFGPGVMQKHARGARTLAAAMLLWPYLLLADLNRSLWAWRRPELHAKTEIGGLVLRRHPGWRGVYAPLLDLCAELSTYPGRRRLYRTVPMLDLVAPHAAELDQAMSAIEALQRLGQVQVCCALGLGRSAAVVAAWLRHSGQSRTVGDAVAAVRSRRPGAVCPAESLAALDNWWSGRRATR